MTYIEKHANNSNNLLLAEVVKNLAHVLNDVELEVAEALEGEVVVRDDPESADDVVCNLARGEALVLEELLENAEAVLSHEVVGELVGLQQEHEAVGECVGGELGSGTGVKEVVQEVSGTLSAVLELVSLDQDGKHVGGQISLVELVSLRVSHKV